MSVCHNPNVFLLSFFFFFFLFFCSFFSLGILRRFLLSVSASVSIPLSLSLSLFLYISVSIPSLRLFFSPLSSLSLSLSPCLFGVLGALLFTII